mmetsp:Transcript_16586/g.23638  ORF Transcript_16586/g.23638 Transcript_16586/m.23638 type:complete len:332 (+) Transcript_16586:193-1188(+)
MAEPTDEEVKHAMEMLVRTVDVDKITTKQFIAQLSDVMGGIDLKPRKKFIKASLTEIIDAMQSNKDSEEEAPVKKKRGAGGLGAEKNISPQLSEFLGTTKTRMARTEVVKQLWEYIREHNLQNPENKREILLDDNMQKLFGVERFSMFHMAKYVGAHVEPFKEVDLTPKVKDPNKPKKKRKNAKEDKKKGKKKGKRAKKEPGEKRKTPASFTAPFRLSQDLQDIVGEEILSRPQVTSALWTYIKANNMQNPEDKREIFCDEKFSKIMGGEQKVTMFTMNKFVSSHLIEKLPVPQAEESSETPVKLEEEIEEDDIASEVFDEEETESEGESD